MAESRTTDVESVQRVDSLAGDDRGPRTLDIDGRHQPISDEPDPPPSDSRVELGPIVENLNRQSEVIASLSELAGHLSAAVKALSLRVAALESREASAHRTENGESSDQSIRSRS